MLRLAYSHETGIVIVDVIQKCVILNATLTDLYRGASISSNTNRDISIQPFATSSILQHHYQSGGGNSDFARRNQLQGEGSAVGASNNLDNFSETTSTNNTSAISGTPTTSTTIANTNTSCNNTNTNNSSIDNESNGNSAKPRLSCEAELQNDNGVTSLHKTCATNEAGTNQNVSQVS